MFITETIRSSYHIMRDLTLVSLKYIFLIFKKINIDSLIFSVLFQTGVQHGNQDEFQSFIIVVSSLLIHYSGQAFHFDKLLLYSQFRATHLAIRDLSSSGYYICGILFLFSYIHETRYHTL